MKRARSATLGLAVALALTGATMALAAHHERAAAPVAATVTYYYIPGCAVCARTSQRLEAALAPYAGRVAWRRVDCTSDEGVAAVAKFGFRSHGLALVDASGRAQLVESDHRVFPEHVVEALGRILPVPPVAAR